MPEICVKPEFAIIDDEVEITVNGLNPNDPITIDACIIYYRVIYVGYGKFYADSQGRINLQQDASHGGTYFGVQPMGLFSSMRPMPSKFATPRLLVRGTVESALNFSLCLWKGHLTQDQVHQLHLRSSTLGTCSPNTEFLEKFFLANCQIKRSYLSPAVTRTPVEVEFENDVICGVLFLPRDGGPFPGVIDIFGGAGGCVETRAALLAKHGYASLALAYFGYPGLKAKSYMDFKLAYFDKVIKWFSQHPKVLPGGVSMVGVCLGAQMILLNAVRNKAVRCAICINSNMIMATECKSDSNPLVEIFSENFVKNHKENRIENLQQIWAGRLSSNYDSKFKLARPALSYDHDNPILFMMGENDNYKRCIFEAIDQLKRSNKKNVHHVIIRGQGHLIEPPYMPLCVASPSPSNSEHPDPYYRLSDSLPYDWNGNLDKHGPSQIYAWNLLLDFLKKHSTSQNNSKL